MIFCQTTVCLGKTCFDCEEAAGIVGICTFLGDGERSKQENEERLVRFVGCTGVLIQYAQTSSLPSNLVGSAHIFFDAENKCSRYMFLVQVKAVPCI